MYFYKTNFEEEYTYITFIFSNSTQKNIYSQSLKYLT